MILSMSCTKYAICQGLTMSVPPQAEYPWNSFNEVYLLSKFNVSNFSMTGDIWIFKLIILLTWRSSKLIVILLTLGKSNLILLVYFYWLWASHNYLTNLGLNVRLQKKNPRPLCLTKNSRIVHRIWHK